MSIVIKKDDISIKLYCKDHSEPVVTIYTDSKVAILRDLVIDNSKQASRVSQAVSIAGIFIDSLNVSEENHKLNNIPVTYFNEGDFSTSDTKYSARKMLRWVESRKIVTVSKKDRTRYMFTEFMFENNKLVILYRPVNW